MEHFTGQPPHPWNRCL